MPFAGNQHLVQAFAPGTGDPPFPDRVRAWAVGRDLHGLDSGIGQDGVKRRAELTGPITDQEPEADGAIT